MTTVIARRKPSLEIPEAKPASVLLTNTFLFFVFRNTYSADIAPTAAIFSILHRRTALTLVLVATWKNFGRSLAILEALKHIFTGNDLAVILHITSTPWAGTEAILQFHSLFVLTLRVISPTGEMETFFALNLVYLLVTAQLDLLVISTVQTRDVHTPKILGLRKVELLHLLLKVKFVYLLRRTIF